MNTYAKEEIQRVRNGNPLEVYLPRRGVELKREGRELAGICPFHKDGKPSLNVNVEKQVWTCRAGCGGGDLLAFVQRLDGIGFAEAVAKLGGNPEHGQFEHQGGPSHSQRVTNENPMKPASSSTGSNPKIVAIYSYTDAAGVELFQAVRLDPKSFRQRRKLPDGKWAWNLEGVEPVLYRLPEVVASDYVWIVEGEKDVDAIAHFGLTATCNPMGAGKWRESYTAALKGKYIVLCGDNDDPGEKHMDAVEKAVSPVAAWTRRLRVPGGYKDISEYLAAATTPEAGMKTLMDIVTAAPGTLQRRGTAVAKHG